MPVWPSGLIHHSSTAPAKIESAPTHASRTTVGDKLSTAASNTLTFNSMASFSFAPEHAVADDEPTMTSLEIAELTGKRHDNVMRDIRKMLSNIERDDPSLLLFEGHPLKFECMIEVPIGKGATRSDPALRLTRDLSITLVSKYSDAMHFRIVRRWQELEAKNAAPALSIMEQLQDSVARNPNQPQKCRTLSQAWQRRDAKAADKGKLPWGHAIKLIFIEVLAKKRSDQPKARQIIQTCRILATSYPPRRDDDRTKWIEAIRELQVRVPEGS